jgi:hypothetical protein
MFQSQYELPRVVVSVGLDIMVIGGRFSADGCISNGCGSTTQYIMQEANSTWRESGIYCLIVAL